MLKILKQKIIFIGAVLIISACPVSAGDVEQTAKDNRHKEFIAQKLERMKKQSRNFQTLKESEEECLQRKKIYDEKRQTLLEQFDLKEEENLDNIVRDEPFDCKEEQKLDKPVHDASHSFGAEFWNMRIKWCPELWWRYDGFDSCEKK